MAIITPASEAPTFEGLAPSHQNGGTTHGITIQIPSPPPNGGTRAWLQVLGGFMLFVNSWGLLNAFGVFQTFYETGAIFTASSSVISLVGSIQGFLLLFVGFLVGPVFDRGFLLPLLLAGTIFVVFGLMILSIASQYWHVLLAQGFSIGIGAGCLFVPCVSIMPSYFSSRLGLAVGIASAGSSVGGLIYPIVLNELLYRIGFAWSVRVLGFLVLGTLLIPLAVMRMRIKPPRARSFIDWSAFLDFHFVFFVTATLIGFIGISILLTYLSFYAANTETTDTRLAFYLVAIFNGASVMGRLTPAALSDITGPFNIAPCAIISGILSFALIAVRGSQASLIALTVLVGLFSGVFVSLPSVCVVAITKDKNRLGTRIGMACGFMAFGLLIGGPGAGAILGTSASLDWLGLWVFCGVAFTVAGLMYTTQRFLLCGFKLRIKV
ncbi:MFS general substrate transporter [Xylariomycetidae sp. FL2044]|nr:MFS general substrate transporter [Xylariomycetidae sp. FL2044]